MRNVLFIVYFSRARRAFFRLTVAAAFVSADKYATLFEQVSQQQLRICCMHPRRT